MFKKSSDALLAIDLAPEAVRVVSAAVRGAAPRIQTVAAEMLPEGSPENLPERHLAALEKLLATHKLHRGKCVAALPTTLVTTRSVLIDPAKTGSAEDQIKQTLQNILTCDAKDLLFDFWNVSEVDQKMSTYEVLVVACQRTIVHRYLDGFAKLRLDCGHLDVAPCALASLIARLIPDHESMIGTVTLGINMGYFAVVEKQRVLFWRPFELPAGKHGEQAGLERIGHEISKCVSHMIGTHHLDTLGEIIVFGNGAGDENFAKYLTNRFHLQVRAPSPFEFLPADAMPEGVKTALQGGSTHYAAALGLALQPAGGSNG